jgi:RimJ/RimL family protein N-acetyltransferase
VTGGPIFTAPWVQREHREADRAPFAALNADPQVAYWLGAPRFASRGDAAVDRYNEAIETQGFGRFAVERRDDGRLIGAVGVMPAGPGEPAGFDLGWRLTRSAWGQGYAAEAARAAMADAIQRDGVTEITAHTAAANLKSIALMERLGMVRDAARDFDHPELAEGDPLRRQIVYFVRRI